MQARRSGEPIASASELPRFGAKAIARRRGGAQVQVRRSGEPIASASELPRFGAKAIDMTRVVITLVLVAVAVAIALVLQRRRPAPPTQPTWAVPSQLDRADFDRPELPWLVVVFTSATCDTCANVVAKARPLETKDTVVQEVEATARRDLHQRYAIDAVPMLLVVDRHGVVRGSLVGPSSAEEIWSAVSDVRDHAV